MTEAHTPTGQSGEDFTVYLGGPETVEVKYHQFTGLSVGDRPIYMRGRAQLVDFLRNPEIAALAPPGMTPEEAWRDLIEMDDRTSPAEYPDHALIDFDELKSYMERAQSPAPPEVVP